MWSTKPRRHVWKRNTLGGVVWDNGKNYYFDSYGIQPPNELKIYLRSPIFYNTEQIQPKQEVFCGHLCLYVLKLLSLGKHLQEIANDLR